jgi:hypothetical protein
MAGPFDGTAPPAGRESGARGTARARSVGRHRAFDGADLSAWEKQGGGEPGWRVADGVAEIVPGAGGVQTRRAFGDVQLHIEWASPSPARGSGQDRGNSGVFFMTHYEVQILDSYDNDTYPDGQAAALYGQYPPLVNASRPPGEWQSYDIIFRRPRFAADGSLTEAARVTVLHNGVLVHEHASLMGRTAHMRRAEYSPTRRCAASLHSGSRFAGPVPLDLGSTARLIRRLPAPRPVSPLGRVRVPQRAAGRGRTARTARARWQRPPQESARSWSSRARSHRPRSPPPSSMPARCGRTPTSR